MGRVTVPREIVLTTIIPIRLIQSTATTDGRRKTVVNKKQSLGIGIPVLLLALVGVVVWDYITMFAGGGSAGSWYDYRTADRLLAECQFSPTLII